ncbi:hypothetical protein OS493_037172 [Desmophyllum pertusum]|uniref:Uncharacterized protein n=1 Tax=Desmophyllum pertusum TaxID=174260 RepID=A0A9X0CWK2_9CNID|nr:hypothetical protein OS493_037172 [Desmophyllum pertusum]
MKTREARQLQQRDIRKLQALAELQRQRYRIVQCTVTRKGTKQAVVWCGRATSVFQVVKKLQTGYRDDCCGSCGNLLPDCVPLNMEKYIQLGKEYGLKGEQLLAFVADLQQSIELDKAAKQEKVDNEGEKERRREQEEKRRRETQKRRRRRRRRRGRRKRREA